jgi:hypothetical protein
MDMDKEVVVTVQDLLHAMCLLKTTTLHTVSVAGKSRLAPARRAISVDLKEVVDVEEDAGHPRIFHK